MGNVGKIHSFFVFPLKNFRLSQRGKISVGPPDQPEKGLQSPFFSRLRREFSPKSKIFVGPAAQNFRRDSATEKKL